MIYNFCTKEQRIPNIEEYIVETLKKVKSRFQNIRSITQEC